MKEKSFVDHHANSPSVAFIHVVTLVTQAQNLRVYTGTEKVIKINFTVTLKFGIKLETQ